jgi:ABC-type uncharacterized transport system permease subunit
VEFATGFEIALIGAYGLASGLYLGFHLGVGDRAARLGRLVFLAGFVIHFVDIGIRCFRLQHPVSSTPEATSFVAWLVAGAFLWTSLKHRLAATGAFAAPTVLGLVVLARVLPGGTAASQSGPLVVTHILLSTAGEALFAFAAVLAALYLIQERRLKRKDFTTMRGDAAPLETLDRLAHRCVYIGFPIFTLAIISGAVLVARAGLLTSGAGLHVEYLAAVLSWFAYGALLIARRSGWRGRRVAWLTVAGFVAALLVLMGYFLRQLG